ncbi:50S ribosomal protein L22 [Candidatus Azambacteria bacterium RIFCSPHIGHO2_01_FULL_40_24]|uniref:Large ribosomal subunit protein uL22 n=1 Tax=Candidatus Azambacteria bacterium RIFCSPHIGHO2_01_FULL_40_24 TaxID=1797301 RepID=A0A1F5B566_9BACT|nr:MAG: 50S ribosomal protein L22 [Candidatus Azambacteria bacterium RIFCSPHIGHO2_01_FULL_40_24]
MQYKFHLNNLRIAPRKVRLVVNLIKKSSALSAQARLKFQNKKAALPVLKLLKSAVSSAVNNFNLSSENLYIANIFVDEGQKLKRFRPRAFGRAGAIHKKTSHITLILEEKIIKGMRKPKKKISKVIIKKEELPKKEAVIIPKKEAPKEIRPARKFSDFTRKIFRRKAIG